MKGSIQNEINIINLIKTINKPEVIKVYETSVHQGYIITE